jgi:hypothetical protein
VTGRLPSDPPQPGATADDLLDWLLQP